MEQFGLSANGFLPATLPLARLPDPYYDPWESVIHRLPSLLQGRLLRDEVRRLTILSTEKLHTEEEWRRAHLILCFLAHAYIWGGETVADVLPPCLTVPLLATAAHLELPPVGTYAALNLWNFTTTTTTTTITTTTDEEASIPFDDLDRLQALHTFTGTASESWFYVVSVAIERRGAPLVPVLLGALAAARARDYAAVTAALRRFVRGVDDLGRLLVRMHERCDPMLFYTQIRPFLAGSKNMADAGLPRGVFYDEGGGRGCWRQLRGGSNGQSALVQFLDIVLGVEHAAGGSGGSDGSGATAQPPPDAGFHEEVRAYMTGPHRRFLAYVAAQPSLRQLVAALPPPAGDGGGDAGRTAAQTELADDAFPAAARALADFRSKHLAIVTRYIIVPARQQAALALASSSSSSPGLQLTGTGGTDLLPFLKQSRDETLRAAFPDKAGRFVDMNNGRDQVA